MNEYHFGILTRLEIIEYLHKKIGQSLFISPMLEEDLIHDTSIDLRLGHKILIPDQTRVSSLDVFDQGKTEVIQGNNYREVFIQYGKGFNLHPGQSILVCTLEYIGMPNDLEGYVTLRSSLSRLPILANTATIHPCFRGVITLSFTSMASSPIALRPGMRVAQLQMHYLSSPVERENESRYDMAIGPEPSKLCQDSDLKYIGPSVDPIIIGLVSTLGAGRTTAVKHFQERHGFEVFSLAEVIKAEANKRGLAIDRDYLQELGTRLRETHGNGFLADTLLRSQRWLTNKNPFVIADGFKNIAEVEEFKKRQRHFYLLAIDAPLEVRWKRIEKLRRIGDPQTLEDFSKLDEIDRGQLFEGDIQSGQMVDRVLKEADFRIMNNKYEDFLLDLEHVLQKILYPTRQSK